jgi:copper chaperone CopZ
MFRRHFLKRFTLAGASGLASMASMEGGQSKSVTWRIKGFSCPTCAVGLEVMLRDQRGVRRAAASYEKATATIEFDPAVVSEATMRGFIADMGFRVENTISTAIR